MRLFLFALLLGACASNHAPAPVVVAPTEVGVSRAPALVVDADAGAPPAQKASAGVTITIDQVQEAMNDPLMRDRTKTYAEHVARAEELLGKGIEDDTATTFPAIAPRDINGPYSCKALVLQRSGMTMITQTDPARCALPYGDPNPQPFAAMTSPRVTLWRLEKVKQELEKAPPPDLKAAVAKKLLVPAEGAGEVNFFGIGPRDEDGPITCHVLRVDTSMKLEKSTLAACGIPWPPPPAAFDPGPPVKPASMATALEACGTCTAKEICMVDRQVAYRAVLRPNMELLTAHTPDGRASQVNLKTSCVPLPPSCNPVASSCFFNSVGPPSGPGPCPKDTYQGHAFSTIPNSTKSFITCFSRMPKP